MQQVRAHAQLAVTAERGRERTAYVGERGQKSITYYEVLVDRALVTLHRHVAHSRPGAVREGEALCRDDLARISGDLARISADLAPISGRRQPSSAAQPRASVP